VIVFLCLNFQEIKVYLINGKNRYNELGKIGQSRICSIHFTEDCFDPTPGIKQSVGLKVQKKRVLLPDAIPTVFERVVSRTNVTRSTANTSSASSSTAMPKIRRETVVAKLNLFICFLCILLYMKY
jgi:hypothetical protein